MIARLLLAPFLSAVLGLVGPPAPLNVRPDPSFGGGKGYVTTATPGKLNLGEAAVVTPANRIAVAGQSGPSLSGTPQVVVAQYRSAGVLDPSFGTNGIFTTAFPPADAPFNATAIAYQPSSRGLVVAGQYGDGAFLLLRLTAAGRLDSTFGPDHNGVVKVATGGTANSVAVDATGRILVGAYNKAAVGVPLVVARFSPDGILDSGWGQNGIVQFAVWDTLHAAGAGLNDMVVAADGGMTGLARLDYIGGDGHGAAFVFRLSPSGAFVAGFGTGGHTEVGFEPPESRDRKSWLVSALTVDSKGRLVLTGAGDVGTGSSLLSARLTPNGVLDPSYGTSGNGLVVVGGLPVDTGGDAFTGGAVLGTRDTVTAGVGNSIVRLTSAGVADTRFAPGGVLNIGVPAQITINAVERWDAGRILVAGSAGNDFYAARYLT